MGSISSKVSAPGKKAKRDVLYGSDTRRPSQRYLADPPHKHTTAERQRNCNTCAADKAARPKETFEAYARRGVIRQSALVVEGTPSEG